MIPASGLNTYLFCRKKVSGSEGRFYICDTRTMIEPRHAAMVQTVEDNLRLFTKREVGQAVKARELLARMGFPSVGQAIRTANSGTNFDVTARDFEVADKIWGKDAASLKGKTKKQASAVADITVSPTMVQKEQVLSVDVMFVKKLAILIGVSTPLDLTLATSLTSLDLLKPSRAAEAVRRGIQYFLGVLHSQGFSAKLIMSDGEGAIAKIRTELNLLGVEVDISGAGGHVARVERRIQVVKERMRTHMHHLPFALSFQCLTMLALYCVSRLNYEPSSTREWGASARELFLGRKADAKRDFRCAFGDYVQSTVPETSNDMRARTEDCVVMLPTGNRTGSVKMLSLATGKIVTRDQFKILPTSMSVIQALAAADGIIPQPQTLTNTIREDGIMSHLPTYFTPPTNAVPDPTDMVGESPSGEVDLADEAGLQDPPPHDHFDHHRDPIEPAGRVEAGGVPRDDVNDDSGHLYGPSNTSNTHTANADDPIYNQDEEQIGGVGANSGGEEANEDREDITGEGDDSGGDRPSGAAMRDISASGEASGMRPEGRARTTLSGARLLDFFRRGGTDIALMGRELIETTRSGEDRVLNITVREAIRTRGEEAERVIMKELSQMVNKRVWTPIDGKKLTADERRAMIRSSMFLKEKYLATGEFEKLKARLVAGGDQQDKDMYDDLSAPTVSTSAVFTVLSIAAHEGRKASVVDIGGAFLNAEMKTGVPVHMRLDRAMSELMIRLQPTYKRFQDAKGCIVVLLNRALYGCVESAALWYDNLRETMTSMGYERNPHDICVFNKMSGKAVQCTVTVHVDDLLITSVDEDMITDLSEGLRRRYGEITKTSGTVLNYLGMVLDFSHPGEVRVSMKGFVEDMLLSSGITGRARTPATEGLFEVRNDAVLCGEVKRKEFHSLVAKLLYLAKKSRPECLTAVAFLATRVTRCTDQDWEKLTRLLRYINDTKE
jgi:Reverse transcriptase (RNA-dependent DNA polymerase)